MLFWAVDEGILLSNPLSRVLMLRERRKPRLMLTVTEEDKFLAAAASHLRSIIIAALDSGMRRRNFSPSDGSTWTSVGVADTRSTSLYIGLMVFRRSAPDSAVRRPLRLPLLAGLKAHHCDRSLVGVAGVRKVDLSFCLRQLRLAQFRDAA
jgi:hypothetical protein